MNAQEENKIRTQAAECDMRFVRKNGHLMICQTLVGNVDLCYRDRVYTLLGEPTFEEILADENVECPVLAKGKKSAVIETLKSVYEIVLE